jgi:cell division protease FtsH
MPNLWVWMVLIAMAILVIMALGGFQGNEQLKYSQLWKLLDEGDLQSVTIYGKERLTGKIKEEKLKDKYVEGLKLRGDEFAVTLPPEPDPALLPELKKKDVQIRFEQPSSNWFSTMLVFVLPMLLLLGIFFLLILPRMRDPLGGSFLSNYIKSPAKRYERTKGRVTFDDVADMESAKSELQEVVEFLRSPEKFQRLGAQVPKGVLLVGPPGTGKTLLARAVAGEAGVPFYSISGSEFIQMFVGVGASRVRDMFKTAKDNAPCLLFIDEIDAVGRMRGAGVGGGSDEREQTLNQILSEMDGFQPNEMVIVIAATNRPDVLDTALLRPGRFDRHVTIDRPTKKGRLEILKVHTRNKPLADDVNLEAIAKEMMGMTGADLRNLANEAALLATREGKSRIDMSDFNHASDRVLRGAKREEVFSEEDKRRTAYHEAGHALVTWLEPKADRPSKVSIIPRGQSLGINYLAFDEERFHTGQDHFEAMLVTMMGGRAADRLVFGQPYAGAENDLKQATRIARYMVTHLGMSDRLGPISLRVGEEHVFLGKEIQEPRDFSEGTAKMIDEEVQRILREADQRAYNHLHEHRSQLDVLAEALLQKEEMMGDEIDHLLREHNLIVDGKPADSTAPKPVFAPGSSKIAEPIPQGASLTSVGSGESQPPSPS